MRPEINYEPTKGIDVKGISDVLLRTDGTVLLKLFTLTHETTHQFHVIGDNFDFPYDGILGQDFWKCKRATIDYYKRVITIGEVVLDFDDETDDTTDINHILTLKSRTESIVQLPTKSKGLAVISKSELAPGVYLAEALTEGVNGYCVASVVNTSEDVTVEISPLVLEEIENDDSENALIFSTSVAEIDNRRSKLRN